MAPGMIQDFIGKQASIFVEGELGGFQGTIVAAEDNWIKVEDKKTTRLVNTDMIVQIQLKK